MKERWSVLHDPEGLEGCAGSQSSYIMDWGLKNVEVAFRRPVTRGFQVVSSFVWGCSRVMVGKVGGAGAYEVVHHCCAEEEDSLVV